ncbi:hypothetical protein [Acinetobacter phage AbpL]|uniref:Uncharacterized protein n=1 Tax=Acinetobacter phage AbpL TaxID=2972532 RepID=A0A976XQB4_9CAUD|nr:hypothetical protein [Acinetobacter phage AbpL]
MGFVFQTKSTKLSPTNTTWLGCMLYDINGKEIGFLGMYSSDSSYWTI